MKNKSTFKFKTLALLVLLSIFTNCSKEDNIVEETAEDVSFETVSIDEAKSLFENMESSSHLSKTSEQQFLSPDLEHIEQETISNSEELMTVIPATTPDEWVDSRVLMLKVDGELKSVLFNMIDTGEGLEEENEEGFTGNILITELDGSFLYGYKVENGITVADLVKSSDTEQASKGASSRSSSYPCPYSDPSWCQLNEVTITATLPSNNNSSYSSYNDFNTIRILNLYATASNNYYYVNNSYNGSHSLNTYSYSWSYGRSRITSSASISSRVINALNSSGLTATERSWISNYRNRNQVTALNNYLIQNQYSSSAYKQAKQFVIMAIGAWITNPNAVVNFDDKIINELTDPCSKNIFTELETEMIKKDILSKFMETPNGVNLTFAESILKMFNDSNIFNYSIQNNNSLNEGENASTKGGLTTMSNSYLGNATQLSIARTMIHEMVHAYLNLKYANFIALDDWSFKEAMDKYATDNGINDINSNEFHHEFMGQYVNAIAISLHAWDSKYGTGGNLGWEYYKSMAFGGLFQIDINGNIVSETNSFKSLVPDNNKRNEIAKNLLNEQKGNSYAKGTKCN